MINSFHRSRVDLAPILKGLRFHFEVKKIDGSLTLFQNFVIQLSVYHQVTEASQQNIKTQRITKEEKKGMEVKRKRATH